MTIAFESDLGKVMLNQRVKYVGQRSFSLSYWPDTQTHAHTGQNSYTWTTEVVSRAVVLTRLPLCCRLLVGRRLWAGEGRGRVLHGLGAVLVLRRRAPDLPHLLVRRLQGQRQPIPNGRGMHGRVCDVTSDAAAFYQYASQRSLHTTRVAVELCSRSCKGKR